MERVEKWAQSAGRQPGALSHTSAEVRQKAFDDCACVIVSYFPDLQVIDRQLNEIASQASRIIVIDNGSGPQHRDYLSAARTSRASLTVNFLDKNVGIAKAQNIGIAESIRLGARYVLLLDHDSIPGANLVAELYAACEQLRSSGIRLGALGARLVEPRTGKENGFYEMHLGLYWRRLRCSDRPTRLIECQFLNLSGSFYPVASLQDVGPFDEAFFIDHTDSDWFMRAKSRGYRMFGLCSSQLDHYMGDAIVRYWLFGARVMPHRSPLRHYYIVRNSIWLYRRSYVPLAWKLNNLLKLLFTLAYFSLFDAERREQCRMIIRGFRDGIAGPRL